jgi:hypothetical protein
MPTDRTAPRPSHASGRTANRLLPFDLGLALSVVGVLIAWLLHDRNRMHWGMTGLR